MKMSAEQFRRFQKQSNKKLDRLEAKYNGREVHECKHCKQLFIPSSHGGKKLFCSQKCANIYSSTRREKKPLPIKKCVGCGNEFSKHPSFSPLQWSSTKFCSRKCSGEAKRINDGMGRCERHRRKNGVLKMGSPEWIARISATTIKGMANPSVREKLQKPRKPLSEEAIRRRSSKLVGKMPKNLGYEVGSGSYANVQRGDYECSKGTVYFRSKWEANYALFLDFLLKSGEIKNWEFEPDVFVFEEIKFGNRSYRPDFKVFRNNDTIEYHEVKGYMNSSSKTKLRRMEKFYPEVKIVLITQLEYNAIYKQFNKILKMY